MLLGFVCSLVEPLRGPNGLDLSRPLKTKNNTLFKVEMRDILFHRRELFDFFSSKN